MSSSSVFKSPQGEARYLAAYDATLALWPVPHQALDVETSFGTTHINTAGAADLPPLLLIHGVGLSSTQWYSNVAALSRYFRIYALDTIGQVGRSVRTHPPMTRAEYAALARRGVECTENPTGFCHGALLWRLADAQPGAGSPATH